MDDLKFPVPEEPLPPPRSLSMDDYLQFVLTNLQYTVDLDACRKVKLKQIVTEPFSLKE